MEPFACKTLLLHLAWEHELQIDTFTTDRSTSIKAMIRFLYLLTRDPPQFIFFFSELADAMPPNYPTIVHYYDIWHFIKVKDTNLLKDKDNQTLYFSVNTEGSMESLQAEEVCR